MVSYSLGDYQLDESFRGSSRSSCTMERKSVTSESSEWVDIETGEWTLFVFLSSLFCHSYNSNASDRNHELIQ